MGESKVVLPPRPFSLVLKFASLLRDIFQMLLGPLQLTIKGGVRYWTLGEIHPALKVSHVQTSGGDLLIHSL